MSTTITLEGGLFDPELAELLETEPEKISGQTSEAFGFDKKLRLADEIQDVFGRILSHWRTFERRREAVGESGQTGLTREAWLLPVLRELGWTPAYRREAFRVGSTTFAVSHAEPDADGEPAVPIHLAPFDQELDQRGRERLSPHALVQELLNRSDHLWGIVTNGRRLRILRASGRTTRQAFLEVDLEAIARDELYPDFALLFRLLHRSRFPKSAGEHDCPLERWHQEAIEAGGRVKERLREGVEKALRLLGAGFLRHSDSTALREKLARGQLSPEAYWRQLLALVYRFLFLMTAEERRLLADPAGDPRRYTLYERWYGVGRLRDLAETRRGRDSFADLWIGLSVLFRALEEPEEAAKLGLAALDGDLFAASACGDLEEARIENGDLLDAILELSTFVPLEGRGRRRRAGARRRVRFSALDVEELGSVYESLLDLHPAIDLDTRSFDLLAGSERKSTGSYYTPDPLVQELAKSALDPVIEARLSAAPTAEAKEKALLSLRVLDPAAGSGHFLLGAARRIALALAQLRTGELEPAPSIRRSALRDVVRHCLYAVDKNPLAVDLAEVALWVESQTPGAPLSFLDHRIRRGDSLLGVFDLAVLANGIPDEAYAPLAGDEKDVARALAKKNRAERGGGAQLGLWSHELGARVASLARGLERVAAMPEGSLEEVRAKRTAFADWARSAERARLSLACDLWCAAFFLPKRKDLEAVVPSTRHLAELLERGERALPPQLVAEVREVAETVGFFHWPLEFPDVMASGGFDVVLGNPPWKVSQLKEEEFFARNAPEIARLSGATRKKAIQHLDETDSALARSYRNALRFVHATNELVRSSERFELTSARNLNLYALFAELFSRLYREGGRAGLIVPTGIATDESTSRFFASLVGDRRLASLFDFENRSGIFQAVDKRYKFSLLTLGSGIRAASFACFATAVNELADERRRFTLSPDEIARINPNTKTLPIFRSKADAELTKKIYARVPVLIEESKGSEGNPWSITFRQGLFHMTSDSGLFRTARQLEAAGARREGPIWIDPSGARWLPLYEAKMIHQFDHRWAGYDGAGEETIDCSQEEKADPAFEPTPRYWVPEAEVEGRLSAKGWKRGWLLGWRDICRATDERTVIASVLPRVGTGDTLLLMMPGREPGAVACLLADQNALVHDNAARQKVGGTHLKYHTKKQLPHIPPGHYKSEDLAFIVPRVLELTYTSRSLEAWARDLGHTGPPFPWDPERRALLRAELDAYFAWLYGLSREELRYVLDPEDVMGPDYPSETFRVLKEKEERAFGEYRTRRLVLEAWDRLVAEGVFDPERESGLSDHERDRARLGRAERLLGALRAELEATSGPVLFVEGASDLPILEAVWNALRPGRRLPCRLLAAGGTQQMKSLAAEGKALRAVLEGRRVFALADNDRAGRELWNNGHVKKGGRFLRHPNGIFWALLPPPEEFRAVMDELGVPEAFRPLTIEQMWPAALRAEAAAEGAYATLPEPWSDLVAEVALAKKIGPLAGSLRPEDRRFWYVRAADPASKEAFAVWLAARLSREPALAEPLRPLIESLEAVLAEDGA